MTPSGKSYCGLLATSVAIVATVCIPFSLLSQPRFAPVLPWSWVGLVRELFGIFPNWEWDQGWWPLFYTLGTLLALVVAAKRKVALIVLTIWFLVNVLIGYLMFWAVSHS